jgi:hypothetical protein
VDYWNFPSETGLLRNTLRAGRRGLLGQRKVKKFNSN